VPKTFSKERAGAIAADFMNTPTELLADFEPSFRDIGGTPMMLFARPQCHARLRVQGIIGVSPVFSTPAKASNHWMGIKLQVTANTWLSA
jgi:hypothetical protein